MSTLNASAYQTVTEFYRRIYWQAPTATTCYSSGYTLSYSGVAWLNSVNHLWLHTADPSAALSACLIEAEQFFRHYHADYNVVFSEPCSPDLIEALTGSGYAERSRNPMLALAGLPHIDKASRDAHIIRITEQHKHDLLHVLYEAFYLGPELSRCMVRADQFADPATRHYVAYVNNEPACCASVLLGEEGIAGVWNVGTLRQYRRRGLASAVLQRALIEAAADGCSMSVLLASEMGRPLYEAMGFRWVGETTYYSPLTMPFM